MVCRAQVKGGRLRYYTAARRKCQGLFAQIHDNMGKQPGGQQQVAHPHPLVRPVEVGVEPGQGAAEGHAAGDVVDVGAAAGGQALPFQAGVLLVPLQQGLDERAVRGDVVGLADRKSVV